jgi:hypothetical protein
MLSLFDWEAQDGSEDVLEQIGEIEICKVDHTLFNLMTCAFGFDEVRREMFVTVAAVRDNAYTRLFNLNYDALC